MSAHTVVSVLSCTPLGNEKRVVFTATGSASYDTNGSTINLGTSGVLGPWAGFSVVYGVTLVGVAAHGSSKYQFTYVPAAAYAAATGTLKAYDVSGASDAEVASTTDLSAATFIFEARGR